MHSIATPRRVKKALVLATLLAASAPLYGCYTPAERALGGGIIGGLGRRRHWRACVGRTLRARRSPRRRSAQRAARSLAPRRRRAHITAVIGTTTTETGRSRLMCGRFTQHLSWEELQRLADLIGQPRNLQPRYNVAPTTMIEVIKPTPAGHELVQMRWGFAPSWWKKPLRELPATFNARAETIAEKPMFRSAFASRRCIIPASGFYEWTGATGARRPHYFTARDGRPLAFAGLCRAVATSRAIRRSSRRRSSSVRRMAGCAVSMIACRSSSTGATPMHGCRARIPGRCFAAARRGSAGMDRVAARQPFG